MAKSQRICSITDCERRHYGRGWCLMHWKRWRRTGDPVKTTHFPRSVGSLAERFWPKVDIRGPDECWGWLAHTDDFGYGRLDEGGRPVQASRISWILHNGPIPEGLCVLHRCDNPPCCNPTHLWLGTKADNNADMARKGRAAQRGEGNVHAKLTEAQVIEIRRRFATGSVTQVALAAEYEVRPQTIRRVVHGENWRHLPWPRR